VLFFSGIEKMQEFIYGRFSSFQGMRAIMQQLFKTVLCACAQAARVSPFFFI
jgi:hypothetical protein